MIIEVPEDKTQAIKRVFNEDYNKLAESLSIVDNRLMIIAPK